MKGDFSLTPEPAPPKSLFAVNKTQTSVTLLWVEEGVADFFEVYCQQAGSGQETKVQVCVSSLVSTLQPRIKLLKAKLLQLLFKC